VVNGYRISRKKEGADTKETWVGVDTIESFLRARGGSKKKKKNKTKRATHKKQKHKRKKQKKNLTSQ